MLCGNTKNSLTQWKEYDSLDEYVEHFHFLPDESLITPDIHDYIARKSCRELPNGKWMHKMDRRTYAYREAIDISPYWKRITCPTLFLRPEHNTRFRPNIMETIKSICPVDVEFKMVTSADHNFILERPEKTADYILDFLSRNGFGNTSH